MADAGTPRSTKYKVVQRSHDGGQMARWQRPIEQPLHAGEPVVENEGRYVAGICVDGPTPPHGGHVFYTVQCSGVCTIRAEFIDVRRGFAPYAWLHQPVWRETDGAVVLRATGDRLTRWSKPTPESLLVGWSLGFDMVSWGVAVRLQLATAAPEI